MIEIILSSVILGALVIGSITDFKKREVPDWLNFCLVPLGIGIRLIWSLITNDYSYVLAGLAGFTICFIIALIMFYTGQWGGGDSKMLMGLGALIGIDFNINNDFISFISNLLIVGPLYGLLWSITLCFKNRKSFLKELKIFRAKIKTLRKFMLVLFLVLVIAASIIKNPFLRLITVCLIIVIYSFFYLFMFIKAVEKSAMLKYVNPEEITEGEWIAKEVYVGKEYISGPKDLGIDKKQLKKLVAYYRKGKIKKVLIKVGIPFVPSFLVAYVISLIFGNLIFLVMNI